MKERFVEALANLADFCNCVSGDLHLMHLQFAGMEFDEMHKNVLKTYYEQAGNDYDDLTEWCIALGGEGFNPNFSAERIHYPKYTVKNITRSAAIKKVDHLLDQVCVGFNILLLSVDDNCPIQIGLANYLQTRLEYWGKELTYFNHRRMTLEVSKQ